MEITLFLKSLEIFGFKSFANKTKLEFRPGVTAIVGPNGCGKSNIVDAIRWVLGEANARNLRGEIMDDIIFSGTMDKKPFSLAEVGLTIINEDGFLPIEYSEVNIKRRFYRSQESEFLINNNNVRLKDIHELFADTGIGKIAYSIMEQGNIDMILSNKPEERMFVFEEAAGITKYKMRMKDSYRKIESTHENLIRLNLLINEVEKEYKNLKKQSEKALSYKNLKKEEIKYETLFNYNKVHSLEEQLRKNSETLSDLRRKNQVFQNELQLLNDSIKENIEKVKKRENDIVEIKNEVYKKEAELETLSSKSLHLNDRIYEINIDLAKKRNYLENVQRNKREIYEKLKKLNQGKIDKDRLIKLQEEKLNNYSSETEYIIEGIENDSRERLKKIKKIDEIEEAIKNLRIELDEVINILIKELDNIKAEYKGNESKKQELIGKTTRSILKIDRSLEFLITKLNDLKYSFDKSKIDISVYDLSKEISSIRKVLEELKDNIEIVLNIQDSLSKILFGKEGPHSKKENIEKSIKGLADKEYRLKDDISSLSESIKENKEKRDKFYGIINNLRPDMARNREKLSNIKENLNRLKNELEKSEESLTDVKFEIDMLEKRSHQFELEINNLRSKYKEIEDSKVSLNEKIKNQNILIDNIVKAIKNSETKIIEKNETINKISKSIEKLELNNAEISSKIETIIDNFRERYSISLDLVDPEEEVNLGEINKRREDIKKEIQALGQINLMAIEDFSEVKKRYNYLIKQKEDVEKAKEDLNILISQTLKSSKDMFINSFTQIKHNFNQIFRRLFNGGKTDIFLTNDKSIFDTGIEIVASPPGKILKKRSLLSGGEKGLTATALLFAIFMVKPSPFCILDEVDHDLDEENVMRFIKLLKEFTDTTQFIIITHNRRTIEFADVVYGVTTQERGISKVVSLDLKEKEVE